MERKQLVWRKCKCGCARRWKCYPDSKSEFYSHVECERERKLFRMQFEKDKTASFKKMIDEGERLRKAKKRASVT